MRLSLAILSLSLLPLPVHAQSLLERMETVTTQTTALLNQGLVLQIPELEGRLPEADWDAPLRDGYSCVLDAMVAEAGEDAVETYLSTLEDRLATATPADAANGLSAEADLPAGLTEERMDAISSECGIPALILERMEASGALEIIEAQ